MSSCDRQATHPWQPWPATEEWQRLLTRTQVMVSSLTQAEVLIALVVAAHAGVLAVRLAASLYRA